MQIDKTERREELHLLECLEAHSPSLVALTEWRPESPLLPPSNSNTFSVTSGEVPIFFYSYIEVGRSRAPDDLIDPEGKRGRDPDYTEVQ